MKKFFKSGLALLLSLIAVVSVSAQQVMPVDTAVVVGKLPNGLTYYIRHNETPKGQADFYIAQKVGSILEEEHQRGLAHFLEHMCFNGTEHFPGNSLVDWLETKGVEFGRDLNAYTSIDETVYNISNVPVSNTAVQDSCLLILHDWACALTLDPEEIEAERGVIHEEWRRSMSGQMRLLEKLLPVVYAGNKYGSRLPIGTIDVIDNFPREAIVEYYSKWYRPDQQGIIVVGDIDPVYIEGKIKELFSHISMPINPAKREYLSVEDNPGTIYAIGSDPEQTNSMVEISFKFEPMVPREFRNTDQAYVVNYMTSVVPMMLNARLRDLANTPDCPFAHAQVGIGDFWLSSSKEALSLTVVGKGGDIRPAVEAAYRELLRAVRGGFTITELERVNAEILSNYQKAYDERNTTHNDKYSKELVRAFIDNEAIPGIEIDKMMMEQIVANVPVQALNGLLPQLVTNDNRVLMALFPEAEGVVVPTEEEFAAVIAGVEAEEIEPYKEEVRTDPLIPNLPAPGKIVSEQALDQWGATELTLSNGVKVIVKTTDYKDNEIMFQAIAKGGYSGLDVAPETVVFAEYGMSVSGLGAYTNSDLKKYMMGKQAGVSMNFTSYTRSLSGNSTVGDLPTLMELIYAGMTEFTIFPDEFAAIQNSLKGILAQQEANPQFVFQKLATSVLYKAGTEQMVTVDIVEKANSQAIVDYVRAMVANAKDFTFTFVGDIDMATFRPLVEQYIATLPTDGKSIEYAQKADNEVVLGNNVTTESTKMETPQTWAYYVYSAELPYTVENRQLLDVAATVFSNRLLKKVREEMGATYSIGAYGTMERTSKNNTTVVTAFPTSPEQAAAVQEAIEAIVEDMKTNITEDEIASIKEISVKNQIAAYEKNNAWSSAISSVQLNGVDTFNGAVDVINSIKAADVAKFWKELIEKNNRQIILLNPAQ